jgi:hypothetical protein
MATFTSCPHRVPVEGAGKRLFFVQRVRQEIWGEHHRHGEDNDLVGESVG